MLTETQRKALEWLRDHPRGVKGAEIAWVLWPDSNMHTKVSNQGHGACRGKAAWLCGGAYLSKLTKKGLVRWSSTREVNSGAYYLTDEGAEALKSAEAGRGDNNVSEP